MNFEVGDIVKLKKQHPCGSSEWEIMRVGADFRLKCMGCGHMMIASGRNQSLAQMALAWVLREKAVTSVLIDQRSRLVKGWKRAVKCALCWAEEE